MHHQSYAAAHHGTLAAVVTATIVASGCSSASPLGANIGSSHEEPATDGAGSTAPRPDGKRADQPGSCPPGTTAHDGGCRKPPAAPIHCPAGQAHDGSSCAPWPPASLQSAPAGGCPADMAALPARQIAAWKATHREKKLFKLDCRKRPESCQQPARTIAAFCIDRTEVTAERYALCVQAGRCTDQHLDCGAAATFGASGREKHPVNCIDHGQAETYCQVIGRRLPSREEFGWAQSSGAYDGNGHLAPPWGGRYPEPSEVWASIGAAPLTGTGTVGAREAGNSRQGVAGLFGNVREWSAPYRGSDGAEHVAWLGYSYETTRDTPFGAGGSVRAERQQHDTATGFRCAKPIAQTAK